jgi:S-adenosylmethionine hydrolase
VSTVISLTTDFGQVDAFVGIMKGVIAGIEPRARVVDLTHAIPPQDVAAGAFALATAYRYFPPETIHVAIVDPGVGSRRRAVALEAGGYRWVAPDNGVLGYALADLARAGRLQGRWRAGYWHLGADAQAVELTDPGYWLAPVSRTFHGRDVFAPVAAHLARGVPLAALGRPLARVRALALPRPRRVGRGWRGQVIHVDRFGNLITNLGAAELGDVDWRVRVAAREIAGLSASYADMDADMGAELAGLGAIVDSSGYLEIALRDGSAAARLGATVGTRVAVVPSHSETVS